MNLAAIEGSVVTGMKDLLNDYFKELVWIMMEIIRADKLYSLIFFKNEKEGKGNIFSFSTIWTENQNLWHWSQIIILRKYIIWG